MGFKITDRRKRVNAWIYSIENEALWTDQLEINSQITNIAEENVRGQPHKQITNKLKTLKKFPAKLTLLRPKDSPHIQTVVIFKNLIFFQKIGEVCFCDDKLYLDKTKFY